MNSSLNDSVQTSKSYNFQPGPSLAHSFTSVICGSYSSPISIHTDIQQARYFHGLCTAAARDWKSIFCGTREWHLNAFHDISFWWILILSLRDRSCCGRCWFEALFYNSHIYNRQKFSGERERKQDFCMVKEVLWQKLPQLR